MSDRAIATRCFCPPDNSLGRKVRRCANPTRSSNAAARSRIGFEPNLDIAAAGNATFSSALKSGKRWWNWKTNPIWALRNFERPVSSRSSRFCPSISNSPDVGESNVPSIVSSVLFPDPLGPDIAINSPFPISRLTLLRTCVRSTPVPKSLIKLRTRYIGAIIGSAPQLGRCRLPRGQAIPPPQRFPRSSEG